MGRRSKKNQLHDKRAVDAITTNRWQVLGICLFLMVIIWIVFGQTIRHEFINYDDNVYVYENPQVTKVLTLGGIVWALTHIVNVNWHPLTMISYMLDYQFYGMNAGGYCFTNVLLHAATAILLFLVLRQMTATFWRSAFVAAVFAIHPLHVESVAWVSERKDVLSGLFFMLTLWAYTRYARASGERPEAKGNWRNRDYLFVLIFFALGLMSKPMLVTLPFVLLLLDYWPLSRFTQQGQAKAGAEPVYEWNRFLPPVPIILEKIPFLVLSAVICVVTLLAQDEIIQPLPFSLRISNAIVSYVVYLGQMICPVRLAVYYPFPESGLPLWEVTCALLLFTVISAGVFVMRQKRPYLLIGWLWYVGMLVPVIGLVQSGLRAQADRYMYLPQIGLYLMVAWALADLSASWRGRRWVLGTMAAGVIATLIVMARTQTSYWRNNESLWTHTIDCTSGNSLAHNSLGNASLQTGRVDDAMVHFKRALEIKPNYAEAHLNLGNALLQTGQVDKAIDNYRKALEISPSLDLAHNNLGNALLQTGQVDKAIDNYRKALELNSNFANAHYNLGNALLKTRQVNEAIAHYQKALEINPNYSLVYTNLGLVYKQIGRIDEAIALYEKALEISPQSVESQNNLALILATCPEAALRNGTRAVELAERANRLTGEKNPVILGTLAAAYAETGRFKDAIKIVQQAIELAKAAGQEAVARELQNHLKLYQAGQPFRER